MTLKWKDMSIKTKIIIPMTLASLLAGIFSFFYWQALYKTNKIENLVTKARSVLLAAESARDYTADQQKLGIFRTDISNVKNLLYTVPIVSALKVAEKKADELGYIMKVPKINPRNVDNEPDSYELEVLKKIKTNNLKEFWEIDEKTNQLRYFRPVVLSEECMICHGNPNNSQKLWGNNKGFDITGGKMEGWKTGQVHGAFEIKMDMALVNNGIRNKSFVIIGLTILTILLMFVVALSIGNKIAKPIKEIEELSDQISQGNVDIEIHNDANDEVGRLSQSFKKLIHYLKVRAEAIEQISLGKQNIALESKSEKDILSNSMLSVMETLKKLVNEMTRLIEATNNGDLLSRGNASNFQGNWENLVFGVNEIVKSFYNVTVQVSRGVISVANSSQLISQTTETMAASLDQLSKQTDEVAFAVEEMSKTIDENAMSTTKTANVAQENQKVAKDGVEVVEMTISKMKEIAKVVDLSANNISKLGESSKEIGEIIGVIEEIADQTNLLALNAAIEAARAGERGRGFAVVADEVRKLAERTTDATKQISKMIKGIQSETMNAVTTMNKGTNEVKNGIELADKASDSLDQIVNSSNELLDMIAQIATASEEQASTSKVITQNVFSISEVTQDSVKKISEIATSIDETSAQASDLRELLSRFNLGDINDNDSNTDFYEQTDSDLLTDDTTKQLPDVTNY